MKFKDDAVIKIYSQDEDDDVEVEEEKPEEEKTEDTGGDQDE